MVAQSKPFTYYHLATQSKVAIMAVSESATMFAKLAKQVGLSDENFEAILSVGITNMSALAFATGYVPGQSDEGLKSFMERLIPGIDLQTEISFRRLTVKSYVTATGELKQSLAKSEGDAPKSVPRAEVLVRLQKLKESFPKGCFQRECEPSQALIDRCVDLYAKDCVEFIPLDVCGSRLEDVLGLKPKHRTTLTLKADGTLAPVTEAILQKVALHDLLSIREALTRRGAALHLGNLLSYPNHEEWADLLLRTLREPPVDSRHSRVTIEQALNADKRLWMRVAELCEGGVQISAVGVKPMDERFLEAMEYGMVQQCLHQHSTSQRREEEGDGNAVKRQKGSKGVPIPKGQGKGQQTYQMGTGAANSKGANYQPKGKGKGKGVAYTANKRVALPKGLIGYNPVHTSGERVCYSWNLAGCTDTTCTRGRHACIKCGQDGHGLGTCPN
jgi:hypothetical protein